jgi:hypothetical protein
MAFPVGNIAMEGATGAGQKNSLMESTAAG